MHRLLLSASAVIAVAGTLVLITVTVIVSDVVADPGVARDVVRATGAQLVGLVSLAWQKRYTSQKSAQGCTARGGVVSG